MAWSYRKRIKIFPGVHLNFSKNGISTSIGVRGASATFSKTGTYLNTSIPGLGIYNRRKISGNHDSRELPDFDNQLADLDDNIFSADIQLITSQDMQGVKQAIIGAHEQREDLKVDLHNIKLSLRFSKIKLFFSYFLLYGLIKKSISKDLKIDINVKKETIIQLQQKIENCYVELDIEFDSTVEEKYFKVVDTFKKLCNSIKIWDVTSENYQDRKVTRSAASIVIKKREVRFGSKSIPDIKSKYEPLWVKNANGADLFFYPNFIAMYSTSKSFAIIGLDEINLFNNPVRFIETGIVPSDSKVIDKTWAKVNKNGTPDKRFKENYQIPIVRYGELILKTNTGLNEEYHLSNYEFCEEFANAFRDFQILINSLKPVAIHQQENLI